MNTKYVAAVAATGLGTTDNAFAIKKREYNQATSQVNDCSNDFQPTDVFCQNLASQIQGEYNSAGLAGEQGGPTSGAVDRSRIIIALCNLMYFVLLSMMVVAAQVITFVS